MNITHTVIMPLILSALTLYMTWLAGDKRQHAWAIGLLNQGLWFIWIITTENWGFLPLTAALTVMYVRNHLKWKRGADVADMSPSQRHAALVRALIWWRAVEPDQIEALTGPLPYYGDAMSRAAFVYGFRSCASLAVSTYVTGAATEPEPWEINQKQTTVQASASSRAPSSNAAAAQANAASNSDAAANTYQYQPPITPAPHFVDSSPNVHRPSPCPPPSDYGASADTNPGCTAPSPTGDI